MSTFTHHHKSNGNSESDLARTNQDRAASPRTYATTKIVDQIIKDRFSCRYYLPKEVPYTTIKDIIDVARTAPSGNNTQPWSKVYCISGALKVRLSAELSQVIMQTTDAYHAQYDFYPPNNSPEDFDRRRKEFGRHFYAPFGIERGNMEARKRVSMRNFEFFGAPVGLFFAIDERLVHGSWLDVGIFIQTIIIAARARGLESITQMAFAKYQAIIRKYLPIKDNEILICGMSLGYPDLEKIGQFSVEQPRRLVEDIVEFHS